MKNSIKKLGIKVLFLVFLFVFIPTSDVVCQSNHDSEKHEKNIVQNPSTASPKSSVNDHKIDRRCTPTNKQTPSTQSYYERFLNFIEGIFEGFREKIILEDSEVNNPRRHG